MLGIILAVACRFISPKHSFLSVWAPLPLSLMSLERVGGRLCMSMWARERICCLVDWIFGLQLWLWEMLRERERALLFERGSGGSVCLLIFSWTRNLVRASGCLITAKWPPTFTHVSGEVVRVLIKIDHSQQTQTSGLSFDTRRLLMV